MTNNKVKDFWWPDITNEDTARKAAMHGAAAAILCSVITGVAAVTGLMGAGIGNLIDAALFGGVALGIKMMSRLAAIGGLILYVVERGYAISQGSGVGNPVLVLFMIMMFVNAVRATSAFHNLGFGPQSGGTGPKSGPSVPNGLYIPPKFNA